MTTTNSNSNKAYPRSPIDEYILEESKALYAACYDDTGVVRISNTPITPCYAENDAPRGEVPFEAFLTTPAQRYWLMDVLFKAENETRWSGEVPNRQYRSVAPIDQVREIKHFDSPYEHSVIFNRTDAEQVNLIVGKSHPEVFFSVSTEVYEDQGPIREQMTLSYPEARLLRDLLNSANLD